MSKNDFNSRLETFLNRLRREFGVPTPPTPPADPIDEFVWSFLLWESTTSKAENALKRIRSATVDFNEFRVALPVEIRAILGERYPLVDERAVRLRASLDDIFRTEHAVTLARLVDMNKRDARQRLDSIEATPPFVAARVHLVALGAHSAPLDMRTFELLRDAAGIFEENITLDEATGILTRSIRAADSLEAHQLIQQWSESDPPPARKAPAPAKKKTNKTSTRARAAASSRAKKKA